jgi:hypothetical protein
MISSQLTLLLLRPIFFSRKAKSVTYAYTVLNCSVLLIIGLISIIVRLGRSRGMACRSDLSQINRVLDEMNFYAIKRLTTVVHVSRRVVSFLKFM